MKAVELINRAYVLSGIVARDLEQVQGSQGEDGIFWLNQLLYTKSMTGDHLPYYGYLSFTGVAGQQDYFVEGLVTADSITFNIGSQRYSMRPSSRRMYYATPRADDINSLPYHYFAQRVNNGMQISFYFKPAGAYIFKVNGLLSFIEVDNDDELDDVMDKFQQTFIMFELAELLALWKKKSLPPLTAQKLQEYRNKLYDMNPRDFSIKIRQMIGDRGSLNYAQINIGKGWSP